MVTRPLFLLTLLLLSPVLGVGRSLSQSAQGVSVDATASTPPPEIIGKIRAELGGPLTEDSKPQAGVPTGERFERQFSGSKIYPGTSCRYSVYVPAEYTPDKPACLVLHLDGIGPTDTRELDNLIVHKELPVMIEVGLAATVIRTDPAQEKSSAVRANRSYEFDSMNEDFPDFVLNELLPDVERQTTKDGRLIRLSRNPDDRMTTGGSSGGIGSFTLAWLRPDSFHRVMSVCGTFVAFRGGNEYPFLVRKTEPAPIRVFIEDGAKDAWNPLFGDWFEQNQELVSALAFAGYDVEHAWGNHGHDGRPANVIRPDVMRWLWRDWPAPVKTGVSRNDMLVSMLAADQDWQPVGEGNSAAGGLASNPQGEVCFSDAPRHIIYKIGADGRPAVWLRNAPPISNAAFGSDGTLYGVDPEHKKIVALSNTFPGKTIAEGIAARGIVVTADQQIYASEPNALVNAPSKLWLIKPTGEKTVVDSGLSSASGVAFSPDKAIFYAAEENTRWVYSYVAQPDGMLIDKQRFDWLHTTDYPSDSGAQAMATDKSGALYVATRMGVQVCDRNGRVRAILRLPTPGRGVQSLCFGGPDFGTLYVTDGSRVFRRRLKVTGYSQWSPAGPALPPSGG